MNDFVLAKFELLDWIDRPQSLLNLALGGTESMMDWDAIGAVGEIVGAAAVVVSLLYLAAQVRTQNKEARLAAMHEITVGYRDALGTFTDEGITNILMKANGDFGSLSDGESMRLISAIQRILRVGEEAYIQFEADRLEKRMWDPMVTQYAAYLSIPAFARVWEMRRQNYDEKFARFLDSLERPELSLR